MPPAQLGDRKRPTDVAEPVLLLDVPRHVHLVELLEAVLLHVLAPIVAAVLALPAATSLHHSRPAPRRFLLPLQLGGLAPVPLPVKPLTPGHVVGFLAGDSLSLAAGQVVVFLCDCCLQ